MLLVISGVSCHGPFQGELYGAENIFDCFTSTFVLLHYSLFYLGLNSIIGFAGKAAAKLKTLRTFIFRKWFTGRAMFAIAPIYVSTSRLRCRSIPELYSVI